MIFLKRANKYRRIPKSVYKSLCWVCFAVGLYSLAFSYSWKLSRRNSQEMCLFLHHTTCEPVLSFHPGVGRETPRWSREQPLPQLPRARLGSSSTEAVGRIWRKKLCPGSKQSSWIPGEPWSLWTTVQPTRGFTVMELGAEEGSNHCRMDGKIPREKISQGLIGQEWGCNPH